MLSRILGLRLHLGALPHRHDPPQSDRHLHRRLPAARRRCRCRCWPRPRSRLPDLLRRHRAAVGVRGDRLRRSAVVAAGGSGAHRQQRSRQVRPRRRADDPRRRRCGRLARCCSCSRRSTASAIWSWFYIGANAASLLSGLRLLLSAPAAAAAHRALLAAACRFASTWPARRCCSTCRWSSTSCWCWRSAARIWPASTPSSCGWSTSPRSRSAPSR